MATYDDYDGVYFTVQAIRLYHPEVTHCTEILVLDNHPSSPGAPLLKELEGRVAGYRYIPYDRVQGNWVRDRIFREANADFVLCVDSHVLFRPGALARLVAHIEAHRESLDLWQGPLLSDDLKAVATHFDPVWRTGMYGVWARDPRGLDPDAPAFEIPMQGLGAFACRRDAWPGYNPRLRGFGVEEGYLHEKIRRAGGRTLCLPFLGWAHRFGRPFGPPYTVAVEDRVRNALLVHDELGLDPGPAIAHFEQEFGAERVQQIAHRVEREMRGPFHFFDAIYCIARGREAGGWESVVRQAEVLGIDQSIRRFEAIDTPACPEVGRALSHRAIVAEAQALGLDNVLVLEDDVRLSSRVEHALAQSLAELAAREWRLLYLASGPDSVRAEGAGGPALEPARGLPELHAVAYHRAAYAPILDEVPVTPTAMARFLQSREGGLDAYCAGRFGELAVVTVPSVATRSARLPKEPWFEPLTADG